MSLSAANLKAYNALNIPQNDTSTAGGGIDVASALSAWLADPPTAAAQVVSSDPADNASTTTKARTDLGVIDTRTVSLNGTTPVLLGGGNYVKILSFAATNAINGIVKLQAGGGPTDCISVNGTTYRWSRVFPNAYSDASVSTTRYDKTFWQNTDALTGLGPNYRLSADPAAMIQQGIHTSINDAITITNRLTAPAGVTFVDDNIDQAGSDLATNDKQGVWWQQIAGAGSGPLSAANSQFTSQIVVASI